MPTPTTFTITPELQAMIAGFGSKAVANVAINKGFDTSVATFPTSPDGMRRALIFDRFDGSEYNCRISNLDGSNPSDLTVAR